jgi:hypothetical protein
MDTCGLQTAVARRRLADPRRLTRALGSAVLAAMLLVACATEPMELGRRPPVERLSQLTPGASTLVEVLAALGEPQGRGAGRLPTAPVMDLLLYESDTMDGTKMRMKMLIVFVNRSTGVYEGYMWFNSGQLLGSAS